MNPLIIAYCIACVFGAAIVRGYSGFGFSLLAMILFFFSSPARVAVGRASVIAFFLGSDLIGLTLQAQADLTTGATLWRSLTFMPPLLAGVWLGSRIFKHADPEAFRRWVLRILILLAVLTVGRGAAQMAGLLPA